MKVNLKCPNPVANLDFRPTVTLALGRDIFQRVKLDLFFTPFTIAQSI